MRRRLGLTLAAIAFGLAATANSGGYRYGVSDQAFYTAAVVKALHPELYPKDSALLSAESRFMGSDAIVASLSRALGLDLPPLYLGLYILTLAALFAAALAFGRAAGLSIAATIALLVLLTFRHRIAKTGANSLEGYMHPRMLAFACGVLGLAGALAGRYARAAVWTALAFCWHPTTAFWFGLVVSSAFVIARPHWRRMSLAAAALMAFAGLWAVVWGPLAGRLVIMDPEWLNVLADKDYLFPHEWPLYAWIANLACPALVLAVYWRRSTRGVARAAEPALVGGLMVLAAVFLLSLPLTTMRVALAVQMQVTRVFWLLDFAAVAYLSWWLVDDVLGSRRARQWSVIVLLAAASATRGWYLLAQDRRLFAMALPDTPWVQAMTWLREQPSTWYVLADAGHAWKYGVSIRLAAEKDVFVEAGKDTALSMYDRGIAMTVGEHLSAIRDFDHLSDTDVSDLARRYKLDVMIAETGRPSHLPELYRNTQFVIYKLR